jgi:hypothetical protein
MVAPRAGAHGCCSTRTPCAKVAALPGLVLAQDDLRSTLEEVLRVCDVAHALVDEAAGSS